MLLDHHAEDVSQFGTIEFWEQNWGGRSHPMSLAFRPMAKYGASKLKSYNKNSTTLDSQMKHPVFIMGMVNPSSPICKALDQCFGYSSFRVWGSVILVPNFIIEKTLKIIENPSNEFMFWRVFLPKKSSRFGTSQMFPGPCLAHHGTVEGSFRIEYAEEIFTCWGATGEACGELC